MAINWSFTASGKLPCHSSPAFLSSRYDYLDSYYMTNKSSVFRYLETSLSMRNIDLIKHLLLCQMKICRSINHAAPLFIECLPMVNKATLMCRFHHVNTRLETKFYAL